MPWMTEGTVHEQGGVRQSLGADWVLPLKPEGRRGHCGWRAGRQFHGDSKKREFAPWDFPCGPAGKTRCALSRGPDWILGQGTRSHLPQQSSCELQLRPSAAKINI